MFLNSDSKRFGWLAALALWPVVAWGQEEPRFIQHPQNVTVCPDKVANFSVVVTHGHVGWLINGLAISHYPDFSDLEIDVGTEEEPLITLSIPKFNEQITGFNNSIVSVQLGLLPSFLDQSKNATLIYKTNQRLPAAGLTSTTNETAIQVSWDASEVTAQYLVSITNVTETPVAVDSPHYVYLPESQDCRWYEFMVTTHECFNSTDLDTRQNTAASIRVAYPNISPVSLQLSGEEVLVDWLSGNSDLAVIANLRNGSRTLMTHTGTLPFSYVATGCAWYNLNVTVTPVQCEGEPDFTQSASIGFTILCPTTPTEPETEVTGESSGTLAMYPSLLAVAAIVPVLKWLH